MKFYEAMKLLEEGRKIRKEAFGEGGYLHKGNLGNIVDEHDIVPSYWTIDGEWEEYIEPAEPTDNTKIEELDVNALTWNDLLDYQKLEILFDKLNEVIRYINKED